MYSTPPVADQNSVLITTFDYGAGVGPSAYGVTNLNPGNTTWFATNHAIYMPLYISKPGIVTKFFWQNGTVVSGNVCMALYDRNFNRIATTGSVAQGTVSVVQEVDVTDFGITPGVYFLGLAMDNPTGAIAQSSATLSFTGVMAVLSQSTAFVLPNPMVPVQSTSGRVFYGGIAFRTLVA